MQGKEYRQLLGEFTFVPASGGPKTFPATSQFIQVIVYGDIRVGV